MQADRQAEVAKNIKIVTLDSKIKKCYTQTIKKGLFS